MTGFIIFFIALNIVYIIYYAVMVSIDLHAKQNADAKEEEESFDVSDIANQAPESIVVKSVEGGTGFQVGDQMPQMSTGNNASDNNAETETKHIGPTPAELHAEACQESMLEIAPMDNEEYSYNDGSIKDYITQEVTEKLKIKEYAVNDMV